MPGGGNPQNPPQSHHHHYHHRNKSQWGPSASTSSPAPKSKPSPNPYPKPATPTPLNHSNSNSKHAATANNNSKPLTPAQIPNPRPDNPTTMPGPRPILPFTDPPPPPPPSYGFHMLDRRTIVLADGSVRTYFALPPDYDNFTSMPRPGLIRPHFPMSPGARNWNSGEAEGSVLSLKRKFGGEDERELARHDPFERQRQQLLQYGSAGGGHPGPSVPGRGEEVRVSKSSRVVEGSVRKVRQGEVDEVVLKKAFLHFVKLVFEGGNQRKSYLADGKQGPVSCLACGRSSKDFLDTHNLIMHAYNSDSAPSIVDHLAFHKALCILMGWNYSIHPDNSKAYQNFSADDAEAKQDDLIMWPPTVLIHNTTTGKGREGRMEGIGNRAMDSILRDLGFTSGKSMSLYSREGHMGIHAVKFSSDDSGLKEAMRLADYFEREKRGRKDWARLQSSLGKDDENNQNLVKLDPKTGEKKRVFYGHLATVADLDKVTFEIKKKVSIVSLREYKHSK